MATKIDAVNSRGGEDLRTSHDFEDVVYVLNYCSGIQQRFQNETDTTLKTFLRTESRKFLRRPNIHEEIECALPLSEIERVDIILEILEAFAKE